MDAQKHRAPDGLRFHLQLQPQARMGEQAQLLPGKAGAPAHRRRLKEIARQLPLAFRRVALVHDAKSPTTCLVVCNNMSEAELAKSRDPDVLRMYYDAVGSERRPAWYPVIS